MQDGLELLDYCKTNTSLVAYWNRQRLIGNSRDTQRENERETEREREKMRERQRQRETEGQRDRVTGRQGES